MVSGWTPLIFAAAGGSVDTVRALLDAYADPRKKLPDGHSAGDLLQTDMALLAWLLQAAR